MRNHRLYNLVTFDPGGVTGWAWFCIGIEAFLNRDALVMDHIHTWDTGEWDEPFLWQVVSAADKLQYARFMEDPHSITEGVTEGFELTQTVGGNDLLLPVEFNAAITFEANRRFGMTIKKQRRTERTSVSIDRLTRMGFEPTIGKRWSKTGRGKDSFAAMQHAVVYLRKQKALSRRNPKRWLRLKLRGA